MNKYQCIICDEEADLNYYTTQATPEEVSMILMHFKICTKHAKKIDESNTERQKKEIQRTIA